MSPTGAGRGMSGPYGKDHGVRTEIDDLERACGGQLVNRRPRPPGSAILTPLGQQLSRQAREYLGLPH
jgi:DNA-binding transcriptional LysR family regulator